MENGEEAYSPVELETSGIMLGTYKKPDKHLKRGREKRGEAASR